MAGKVIPQMKHGSDKLLSNANATEKILNNMDYSGGPVTEKIANGFFTVNHEWTVEYWNNAAEKLLGVLRKDIIGRNLWEKFAGLIPLDFYTAYHGAFIANIPFHFKEYWAEMGAWFDVNTYCYNNTLSMSFKRSNYPVNAVDSYEQMKAFNELYRFVTKITNDCLWEWNLHSKELFWIDGGHKRVFGYPIENAFIPDNFWKSRIHPDDRARILSRLDKIITRASASVWEDEYRYEKADGSYAYVHDRGQIIYEAGEAVRIIGATQDISVRKLKEFQLSESEKKLSLINKQTVNAIIITDAEEKITWVNRGFTDITGYEQEEVIGKISGNFLQGEETERLTLRYQRKMMKDKKPFECEIMNYSKSGRKYWVHVQGQPLFDEMGNFEAYYTIETDITEKILLENKLLVERQTRQREINQVLLTAQENERSDMGKELQDNLNQILIVAKMYIHIATNDKLNREKYLNISSGHLQNVIEEIRKISKALIVPGMHVMGLFETIRNLLEDLNNIQPIKIEFYEQGITTQDIDEELQINIFRIVQDQVNNILRHSKATQATINLSKEANEIILIIADNGKGCNNLKGHKGSGIINIINRADLYHGKVTVTTKHGKGYILKVVLPLDSKK